MGNTFRAPARAMAYPAWFCGLTGGPVLHADAVLAQAFVSGSGKLP